MEEKRLIRKQIFAARKQCSDAQVEEWSHQITDQVLKLSEFVKAKHILAYAFVKSISGYHFFNISGMESLSLTILSTNEPIFFITASCYRTLGMNDLDSWVSQSL